MARGLQFSSDDGTIGLGSASWTSPDQTGAGFGLGGSSLARGCLFWVMRKDQRCQFVFGGGSRPLVFFRDRLPMEPLDLGLQAGLLQTRRCRFLFGWLQLARGCLFWVWKRKDQRPVRVWGWLEAFSFLQTAPSMEELDLGLQAGLFQTRQVPVSVWVA